MSKNNRKTYKHITTISILVIVLIWYLITLNEFVDPKIIPSPMSVMKALKEISVHGYKHKSLLYHLSASLGRLLGAFILSCLVGVPLGLWGGFNKKVRAAIEPIIEFIRPLPPLAYYTILVLWLGIGNESKVALLFVACLAPIFSATISSVANIPVDYINCAYVNGASDFQVFKEVIFKASLPQVLSGMRTAFGVGYTTLISAEMVAAVSGIGWMVLDASRLMRSDIIFAGILIMGVTGLLISKGLFALERYLVPWSGKGSV